MTADKKFKRLVAERALHPGGSYAAPRRSLLAKRSEQPLEDASSPQARAWWTSGPPASEPTPPARRTPRPRGHDRRKTTAGRHRAVRGCRHRLGSATGRGEATDDPRRAQADRGRPRCAPRTGGRGPSAGDEHLHRRCRPHREQRQPAPLGLAGLRLGGLGGPLRSNAAHPRPRAIARRTTGESDHVGRAGCGAVRVLGLGPGAPNTPLQPAAASDAELIAADVECPVLRATETLPH